jgi:hypothetical protein
MKISKPKCPYALKTINCDDVLLFVILFLAYPWFVLFPSAEDAFRHHGQWPSSSIGLG